MKTLQSPSSRRIFESALWPLRMNSKRIVSAFVGVVAGLAVVAAWPTASQALADPYDPKDFRDDDAVALEALAAHPQPARRAALVVAGHPEELLETQKIQRRSADEFSALLESYPRKTQENIWNLVRYRELTQELGSGGRKTNAQLERIAEKYPEADRAAIIEEGRERYSLWVKIYALDLDVEQNFFALLAPLPSDVRDAFNTLTEHPELTSLLIDNMQLTTVLGATYREDPTGVEAHLASLHEEALARRSEDAQAWAEEVADPEAAEELELAARAFAEEYDYDLEPVESATSTTLHVRHHFDGHPYRYWFGYPHWYDFAYWYPRPIWGHVGFRFGPRHHRGHRFVSVGLPSLFFLDWYHGRYGARHRAAHHRHSNRAKARQVRYYEKHRPRHSVGHRRHHDSRIKRARLDRHRDRPLERRRTAAERRQRIERRDRDATPDLRQRGDRRRTETNSDRRRRKDSRTPAKRVSKRRPDREKDSRSTKSKQRREQTRSKDRPRTESRKKTERKKSASRDERRRKKQDRRAETRRSKSGDSKLRSSDSNRRDRGQSRARSERRGSENRKARATSKKRSGSKNRGMRPGNRRDRSARR